MCGAWGDWVVCRGDSIDHVDVRYRTDVFMFVTRESSTSSTWHSRASLSPFKYARTQVLSASSGRFLRCIGSEGHGEGRLLEPVDCEVHNNRVYVVDALNFRIQVFCALKGSVLCTWGSRSLSVGILATAMYSYIEAMCTLQSMTTITVCVKFLRNTP